MIGTKVWLYASTAVSLTALLIAGMSSASAAPPSPKGQVDVGQAGFRTVSEDRIAVAAATNAPTCVTTRLGPIPVPDTYQDLWITNNCPIQVRVKAIWSWGSDSPCYAINSKVVVKSRHSNLVTGGKFDRLVAC